MHERSGQITETPDFAASQEKPTNGVWITRPAFKPILKVDRAEFVLVGSLRSVFAHCYERNLIR
jgi:hypothetical protein